MFLKIATVLAALGVLLHLVFQIVLQVIFGMRIYNPSMAMATRVISVFDALLFCVALLIFFVAFLLSQKPASAPAQ